MQSINSNILDISHNHYNHLLNLQNVHAVGLGYKRINNINTFEPCIHVLVEEKIDEKYLSQNNIIPRTYMGIKTDVIKVKKFKKLSNKSISQKLRPLEAGASISTYMTDGIGTLGCIVTKILNYGTLYERAYFILSNAHVLSQNNELPIGSLILQPGDDPNIKYAEDEIVNNVAVLWDFVPIIPIKNGKKHKNSMDAAIAKIVFPKDASNKIYGAGKIKGSSTPYLGQKIKKIGYKSGYTSGEVLTIGVSEVIDFDGKDVFFKNQITANLKNYEGDSGSVVLNKQNEAVGLLFGGSDTEATMTDINIVLKRFKVEIFTGNISFF